MKARITLVNELNNMEYSANQLLVKENARRHDIPVIIMSRGKRVWPHTDLGDRREQTWINLQSDIALISNRSFHFIAKHSGHVVHLDEPRHVTETIRFALKESRNYLKAKALTEKYHIRLAHIGFANQIPMDELSATDDALIGLSPLPVNPMHKQLFMERPTSTLDRYSIHTLY